MDRWELDLVGWAKEWSDGAKWDMDRGATRRSLTSDRWKYVITGNYVRYGVPDMQARSSTRRSTKSRDNEAILILRIFCRISSFTFFDNILVYHLATCVLLAVSPIVPSVQQHSFETCLGRCCCNVAMFLCRFVPHSASEKRRKGHASTQNPPWSTGHSQCSVHSPRGQDGPNPSLVGE